MSQRIYHMADKTDRFGGVSALCYVTPRRINLKQASWTLRPEAVTCLKCRAKLEAKAGVGEVPRG